MTRKQESFIIVPYGETHWDEQNFKKQLIMKPLDSATQYCVLSRIFGIIRQQSHAVWSASHELVSSALIEGFTFVKTFHVLGLDNSSDYHFSPEEVVTLRHLANILDYFDRAQVGFAYFEN